MRTLLLASALLLPMAAHATGNGPNPPPFQGGNSTAAANANATGGHAKAFQAQHQSTTVRSSNTNVNSNVARGGQGGSARSNATGGAATAAGGTGIGGAGGQGGTSGPVSVNVDASSNDRAYAMGLGGYAAASGPCVGVSTSAGVGILGWMAQGGRTEIEDECQVREAARIAASVGMVGLAQDLIRSLPSVRKAIASLEPAPSPTATTATPARVAAAPSACAGVWRNGNMPTGC